MKLIEYYTSLVYFVMSQLKKQLDNINNINKKKLFEF